MKTYMPTNINRAIITYFGRKRQIICDRNCKKAWGINSRPYKQLSSDIVYLSDQELGEASIDSDSCEGIEGKPLSPNEFPTIWCVRECERLKIGKVNEQLELRDWTKRLYILPPRQDD